ncbi:hypothetical protein EYF80_068318 [Liparis tanakae]|uniref:Uncharacterized protein n=1 Tax=Liparis tanakae TaxID=230148 RepID=A0A4Z2DZ98_9TELE|nr:hypothetical protein EYF80_068318 [Liparis tanakae]
MTPLYGSPRPQGMLGYVQLLTWNCTYAEHQNTLLRINNREQRHLWWWAESGTTTHLTGRPPSERRGAGCSDRICSVDPLHL